jgi:hypothetical protein
MPETVLLIANGDLRLSANQNCWAAQQRAEEAVMGAIRKLGREVRRGHPYDPGKKHGFIDSQKLGMQVFRDLPPEAPLVVVEAVWQYSHHIFHGLYSHRGPILTVANWSGECRACRLLNQRILPGPCRILLWSEDFTDSFFSRPEEAGRRRVAYAPVTCAPLSAGVAAKPGPAGASPRAIMGIFDEGCMGCTPSSDERRNHGV